MGLLRIKSLLAELFELELKSLKSRLLGDWTRLLRLFGFELETWRNLWS